ncbi:MAG TPA: choice-of-anchor tandem repeat NxxGxxAF-containing protein [Tepidisphaeraceae bacterium]|jgi:hypothetical protein|nr:choice-of-anchor tandem repeat NxxGxxAF-containing protein [Tepidisphaeraceae bacterium]
MRHHHVVSLAIFFSTTAAFAQIAPDARPKVIYTPIVLTGQSAPGGGAFSAFPYHSFIDDANQIVFLGATDGNTHTPNGIFLATPTGNQLVAKAGAPAPGLADGVQISGFDINYHRVNTAGQVTFEGYLAGPGIDSTGDDNTNAGSNWIWSNGQLQLIAQFQTPAPGTNALFRTFDRTTLNDLGQVAFRGVLTGPSVTAANDSASWMGAPGDLQILAREGNPAPGGLVYGDMQGFDYPVLSPKGKVAFLANVAGGNDPFNNRAFFAGTPGNLELVAHSGDAAPGTNSTFHDIHGGWNTPRINDNGQVIFVSTLNDGTRGIWSGKAGQLQLVARTEDPAPGLSGATYDFFFDLGLNARGDIAFRADVKPTDDEAFAIYGGRPNHPDLIAASGQHAPGTEEGVLFGYLTDPVINKDGQVAFFGYLTGENSRGPNDYGIFATGHNGDLRLIARFGDDFEVAPGDIRTIQALSHAGVFGTHILTFNAESNLVFLAKFTDGSEGIFTATVLPEPATFALLVPLTLLLRRRRFPSMVKSLNR